MNAVPLPLVSIIIPVYNDSQRLKTCLEALSRQSYPQDCYEIIVVDNGSETEEAQRITAIVQTCPQARLTVENTPGSYAARNRGIHLAQGEILAFTDADCIPATQWLEAGVQQLQSVPNCGLVAGKIEIFFQNPERLTPVELFEKVTAFEQQKYVEKEQYGATANLFTSKKVMDKVGNFNAEVKSSGDVDWGKRVAAAGYQQVYAEQVCVAHPARFSWQQIHKRTARLVGGKYDLKRHKTSLFNDLTRDFVPPVNFAIATFQDNRLKTIAEKTKVILVMVFIRYIGAWEKIRLILGGASVRE
jgi:glycosyltransferase involved in cell wall biosynthesis